MPLLQTYLFSRVSTRTSFVPIICVANFLMARIARGAFFLKVLRKRRVQVDGVVTGDHIH